VSDAIDIELLRKWFAEFAGNRTEFVIRYLKRSKRHRILEVWEIKEYSLGRRISRGQAIKMFMEEKQELSKDSDIKDIELLEVTSIAK
jgi:hypothetical protein